MSIYTILLVIALICEALGAASVPVSRINMTALGLFFFFLALLLGGGHLHG